MDDIGQTALVDVMLLLIVFSLVSSTLALSLAAVQIDLSETQKTRYYQDYARSILNTLAYTTIDEGNYRTIQERTLDIIGEHFNDAKFNFSGSSFSFSLSGVYLGSMEILKLWSEFWPAQVDLTRKNTMDLLAEDLYMRPAICSVVNSSEFVDLERNTSNFNFFLESIENIVSGGIDDITKTALREQLEDLTSGSSYLLVAEAENETVRVAHRKEKVPEKNVYSASRILILPDGSKGKVTLYIWKIT